MVGKYAIIRSVTGFCLDSDPSILACPGCELSEIWERNRDNNTGHSPETGGQNGYKITIRRESSLLR